MIAEFMTTISESVKEGSKEIGKEGFSGNENIPTFAKGVKAESVTNFEAADQPLQGGSTLDSIESFDASEQKVKSPFEQLDNGEKSQIDLNREHGDLREAAVHEELTQLYPAENYEVIPEQYLRDSEGRIVKDVETGEARRVDFVVVKDGEVVRSIEVTSETASKDAQLAKEGRIREQGGEWIRNPETGELCRYGENVNTEVWRRV
ncbi:hypothetical protein MJ257_12300 [Paenibacillus timonensis]|uniref:Uncharacterized protein n=1 Tax=Paenibacillus timonensis TaxID=225915 RepID=A0ABW3SED6_9BACL|nr:hypothetical protein [Paenibacillus timonensis]MCH1640888.1 hypothetical protein [Paenibacillus timonensis]